METKMQIIEATRALVAKESFEGFSVRKLAKITGLSPSHLYYYTRDTQNLFREVLEYTAKELGIHRAGLPSKDSAAEMLEQRINFQFENAEHVIYILKYYITFREVFKRNPQGYVPQTAYKHILEVLEFAEAKKEWCVVDKIKQAKVITHAINGFVLEYYPEIPDGKERARLIEDILEFLLRSLRSY
jgi:AcrR family transcriptional regulator